MKDQTWKEVLQDARYEISSSGNIRRRINLHHPERNRPYVYIKPWHDKDGYIRVSLCGKKYLLHRLIYQAFCGHLIDGMVICHLNNDKTDNRPENLLQATQHENIQHKRIHGTWQSAENHPKASISNEMARMIKHELMVCEKSKTGRMKKGTCAKLAEKYKISMHVIYELNQGSYGDA
jgi:hypothetical protein